MEEFLAKLRQAADIRSEIAKRESAFWQMISEAAVSYSKQIDKQATNDPSATSNRGNRDSFLDTKRAAEYLGLKYGALAGWRFQGIGPKYVKLGRVVRYRIEDLDSFAEKQRRL